MRATPSIRIRAVDWLAFGGVLLLAFLVAYVLIGSCLKRIETLNEEQQTLALELDRLTEVSSAVTQAERVLEQLKAGMSQLDERLPPSMDFATFYTALTDFAEELDVAIAAIRPGDISEKGDYVAMPVSVTAHGRFSSLHRFIFAIGNLRRLNKLERLQIAATSEPETCSLEMTLGLYAADQHGEHDAEGP